MCTFPSYLMLQNLYFGNPLSVSWSRCQVCEASSDTCVWFQCTFSYVPCIRCKCTRVFTRHVWSTIMPDQYRQQTSTFRAVAMLLFPASRCYWWYLWLRPTLRIPVICAQQRAQGLHSPPPVRTPTENANALTTSPERRRFERVFRRSRHALRSLCERELSNPGERFAICRLRAMVGVTQAASGTLSCSILFFTFIIHFYFNSLPTFCTVFIVSLLSVVFDIHGFFRSTDFRFTGRLLQDIMPSRLVCRYQRFGRTCCFHL